MAIVQTNSPDAARGLAQADPGVIAGTLRVEVTEWRLIDWDRLAPSSITLASCPVYVSYVPSTAAE
jgi:hypothetical protein